MFRRPVGSEGCTSARLLTRGWSMSGGCFCQLFQSTSRFPSSTVALRDPFGPLSPLLRAGRRLGSALLTCLVEIRVRALDELIERVVGCQLGEPHRDGSGLAGPSTEGH